MKNKFVLVLLFLFLAFSFDSNAGIEIYTASLTGSEISNGSSLSVYDHKYGVMEKSSGWKNQFTNYKIYNRVIFSFDEKNQKMIPSNTEFTIDFDADYFTYDASTNAFIKHTITQKLQLNYDPSKSYQNKALIQFDGGNGLNIRIKSITNSSNLSISPVKLEGQIEVTRYYNFDVKSVITNVNKTDLDDSTSNTPDKKRGEVEISWDYLYGAEEYELEWTHIDDYNGNNLSVPLVPSQIQLEKNIFKQNSTRITTTSNSFRIPLMYERGYVVFRVRGIGKTGEEFKSRVYSKWSFEQTSSCTNLSCIPPNSIYKNNPHHEKLNWQASISFAEDGKNKVAVTYFDGSLRSRQIVSKSNTEDQVIVGETLYDHQGRAVIQVLPVPVSKQNIKKIEYKGELSKNSTGDVFNNTTDYDVDNEEGCIPLGKQMSTLSGASQYYSPNNLDKSGSQQFIPDAEGYPYTHVEYTPDNTGRIRRQSGVGKTHKLGSGKETQYMYSKPFQEELDRIFGSEVGLATRYKKNMVIDANGQVSVSYLDPQGKVIATALAGETPNNVDQIPNGVNQMTIDLLNKENSKDNSGTDQVLNFASGTKELGQQISVSTPSTYIFNYEMKGDKLISEYVDNQGLKKRFCTDCVFDLKIRLKDECGNDLLPGINGAKYLEKKIGNSLNGLTDNQNYVGYNVKSDIPIWQTSKTNGETISLKPGEYSLIKELKLNQDALNYYSQQYLAKMASDAKPSFEKLYEAELAKMDFQGCNWTCEVCKERAGNDQEKLAACQEICDMESEVGVSCESKLRMLIGDMSPNGQYGGVNKNLDTALPEPSKTIQLSSEENKNLEFDPSVHSLSIFNSSNLLPKKSAYFASNVNGTTQLYPDWRHPYNPQEIDNNKKYNYLLEDGTIAYVIVKKVSATEYEPKIENATFLEPLDANQQEYFKIPAKYLKNVNDFVDNWNLSYANSLIYYHPEYAYYQYCIDVVLPNKTIVFDEILMTSNSKKEALDLFAKNKITVENKDLFNLISVDPFFNSVINISPINGKNTSVYKALMQNLVSTYVSNNGISYSMRYYSYLTSHCPNFRNDAPNCALVTSCLNDSTGIEDDKHWQVYKSFYISLKQKFSRIAEINYVIDHTSYNGCIGVKPFNPFENNFFTSTYVQPVQVNTFWSWLTKDTKSMKTVYNHRSQFLNPEQTCSFYNASLFEDKVARNPLPSTLLRQSSLDAKFCYPNTAVSASEYPSMDLKDFVGVSMLPTDCAAENQYINDKMLHQAEAKIFMECGQCPKAFQLQNFISAVASRDKLTTNNISLLCNPNPYYEIGPKILPELKSDNDPNIEWKVINHIPKNSLKIELKSGSKSTILDLKMSPKSELDFGDLDLICCLNATDLFEFKTTLGQAGTNFKLRGIDEQNTKEQIDIEGTISNIRIDDCNFDYECQPTIFALQSQSLFNALLYKDKTTIGTNQGIQSKFLTTTGVSLGTPPASASEDLSNFDIQTEVPIYGLFVTDEMKTAFSSIGTDYNDWMWQSTVSDSVLIGHVYDKDNSSITCDFTLSKHADSYDFNQILQLSNISPIHEVSLIDGKYTQRFNITAMVKESNQIVYKTLTGNSTCGNIGSCTIPISYNVNQ
ncbi:MAG: hypothetical protein ACK48V_00835 [Crocinitomicaceae bacterium]